MEVSFCFPLPYDGAIDQMTFLVDGKEFPARLLKASEARKIYEDYVRRPDAKQAVATYTGKGQVPIGDFRLFFDVGRGQLGASVLSYRPERGDDGKNHEMIQLVALSTKHGVLTPYTSFLADENAPVGGLRTAHTAVGLQAEVAKLPGRPIESGRDGAPVVKVQRVRPVAASRATTWQSAEVPQ